LLVEDNPDHAQFALKALANDAAVGGTFWVKDGQDAIDFLHRRRQWADPRTSPRPDLILLDINLPKVSGHDVLREIKSNDALRAIPVVMFTTSADQDEVMATYRAGANSYLTKPVKFTEYRDQMKVLKQYWTLISSPPPAETSVPTER
jgi:CheY-like chemotaxis protein